MIAFPEPLLSTLRSAEHIVALTGAGISAESGIPTFRQAQTGLWAQYRPEDLATPQAFEEDPRRVWEWYAWRRELIRQSQPNRGHLALARLETLVPDFTLITQNVDGLHQKAGSQKVIEFHGNIFRTRCSHEHCLVENWQVGDDLPPRCPVCHHYLRPDVVWFGEQIPSRALRLAYQHIHRCQVFLSIGTSGLVEPAASLPFQARRGGSMVIEINLEPTPLTNLADHAFQGQCGEILPRLIEEIWQDQR